MSIRYTKTAVTAVLTVAALTAGAATASAYVDSVTVASGLSFGTSTAFGTDCSYTVTATATPGDLVEFWDGLATFDPPGFQRVGDDGRVSARWTPYAAGNHQIWAYSSPNYTSTTTQIHVDNGVNLAIGCVVLP